MNCPADTPGPLADKDTEQTGKSWEGWAENTLRAVGVITKLFNSDSAFRLPVLIRDNN